MSRAKKSTRRPCRRCVEAVAAAIDRHAKILRKVANERPIPSVSGRMLALRASEREHVAAALRNGVTSRRGSRVPGSAGVSDHDSRPGTCVGDRLVRCAAGLAVDRRAPLRAMRGV